MAQDQHNHEKISTVYFENSSGYVIVAPDHRHPTPSGFERRECRSLRDIDRLTARLHRQDSDMLGRLIAKDREAMRTKHTSIRSKLGQRLLAVDCSPLETLFIRRMFAYLDRKEAELLKCEVHGYFQQREFDSKHACTENYGKQLEATAPRLSSRLADILTK